MNYTLFWNKIIRNIVKLPFIPYYIRVCIKILQLLCCAYFKRFSHAFLVAEALLAPRKVQKIILK